MSYENLKIGREEGVAVVTIDRPEKLNALNDAVIDELGRCFSELAGDDSVRAVVVTGSGEKAFVAGADISELADRGPAAMEALSEKGQSLMWKIEHLGKPVIAAINGYAFGGGCELALACSFRYAAHGARMGLPEIKLGLIPGYGGTQRLARLIGRGRALELILTGAAITAERAHELGLVEKVLPQDDLLAKAVEAAGEIAAKSRVTVRLALKAVNEGLGMTLDSGCRLESALFGVAGGTEDAAEGCRAFLEKRDPEFRDR